MKPAALWLGTCEAREEVAARERTASAWERTALSMLTVGAILLNVVDHPSATFGAVSFFAAGAIIWALCSRRVGLGSNDNLGTPKLMLTLTSLVTRRLLMLTTASVVTMCCATAGIGVLGDALRALRP